jgi:hypothetical protein
MVLAAGLALAGCGNHRGSVAFSCTTGTGAVLRALNHAPGAVALSDGTRLSDCVAHAISDTDLEDVGSMLIGAGDSLARQAPTRADAAYRLGFLAGAAERGASGTGGIAMELVDRLDRFGGDAHLPPAEMSAFRRGRAAGRTRG